MFPEWYRYGTNCAISSAPQKGKSKLTSLFFRNHVVNGNYAVGVIDVHGSLFDDCLNFLTYIWYDRPVVIFNASHPEFIVPFNPFRFEEGFISEHIARLSDLILKAWGLENSDELPRYERVVQIVLAFCAYTGEPIHRAIKLLERHQVKLREWAMEAIKDDTIREDLRELHQLCSLRTGFNQYLQQVESTRNKLRRFVASESVRLFTGLPGRGINFGDIWDYGAIFLADLTPSPYLSEQASRIYAALIQGQIFYEARKRMRHPSPFFLYCDEAQEYFTHDMARMLNQTPKSGLRITSIFHHSGEFHRNPHILESIRMGSEIKIYMGGLLPEQAEAVVKEVAMPQLNRRVKKQDRVFYVTRHHEEPYEEVTETHDISSHEGFAGEHETGGVTERNGQSIHYGSHLIPHVERIVDGQEDLPYQEKLSILTEKVMSIAPQEAIVKIPDDAYLWEIAHVDDYSPFPDTVLQFCKYHHPDFPSCQDAQNILTQQDQTFLERSRPDERRLARPKKRPPTLHRQG